jgi:hypothetical protein
VSVTKCWIGSHNKLKAAPRIPLPLASLFYFSMESNHIGTPPAKFSCWESKLFYVHNFLELLDEKGHHNVVKSEFHCFGHDWVLAVLPNGDDDAKDSHVATCLCNCSNEKVTIDYEIVVVKKSGQDSKYRNLGEGCTFYSCDEATDDTPCIWTT